VGQVDEFLARDDAIGAVEIAGGVRPAVDTDANSGGEQYRHGRNGL